MMKPLECCKNCNGINESGEFRNRLNCVFSCDRYASENMKNLYDNLKVNKGCSTCKNCEYVRKYPDYITAEECVCTVGLECDTVLFTVKNCPKWVGKFESEEKNDKNINDNL